MLKYRLLRQNCAPNMWCVRALVGIDPDILLTGSIIDAPEERLQIILAEEGDEQTDYIEWPCFAVSSRMREALEKAGVDNIQYFAASVVREGSNNTLDQYWVGNVLGLVSCAEAGIPAEINETDGDIQNEAAFYVNPAAVRDLLLFRVLEHRSLVLVHEGLPGRLLSGAGTGLVYQNSLDYDGAFVE